MIERFVPQPYPLWAGLWEDDKAPVVCPVIGWQAPDPDDPDLLEDAGLSVVLARGHDAVPAISADVVEYFPNYELAQRWLAEHPGSQAEEG